MTVELVNSEADKSDPLTRVPQTWLRLVKEDEQQSLDDEIVSLTVEQQHQQHHFGVERTLQLARQLDPAVKRQEVEQVVRRCARCSSIDPAPCDGTRVTFM